MIRHANCHQLMKRSRIVQDESGEIFPENLLVDEGEENSMVVK
jgi:hypothetical protein